MKALGTDSLERVLEMTRDYPDSSTVEISGRPIKLGTLRDFAALAQHVRRAERWGVSELVVPRLTEGGR